MTLQACINLGECYLSAAFNIYNNGLENLLEKSFPVNPKSFSEFGITYLVLTTLACGMVQASKLHYRNREYHEIISSHGKKATYIDSLSLMLTPLWVTFELSYLLPMTKFYNPDVAWGIFQDKVRLVEYTSCKSMNPLEMFTEGFKPLAKSISHISNQSINRMAQAMGGTALGISILLSIQIVCSCAFHRKIGLPDLFAIALIVGAFAISFFSLSQSDLVDITSQMNQGISDCNHCNQTEDIYLKRINFKANS